MGLWNFFFFEMAESHILGIYFQQHDEAELERPNSIGSGNSSGFSSLSLYLNLSPHSLSAGNGLFIHEIIANITRKKDALLKTFCKLEIPLSASFPQGALSGYRAYNRSGMQLR